MKHLRNFLALALIFISASAWSQENMEDVIYLKNGNVYRGMIIEQVPNATYKIQIAGGSIFMVNVAEVQKITREARMHSQINHPPVYGPEGRMWHDGYRAHRDSLYVPRYQVKRGHFFLLEFRGGFNSGAIRIVNGYKFGRLGYLGIGIGADRVSFDQGVHIDNFNNNMNGSDIYLPLYLRYAGDILKTRITPFYYAELGYAMHPSTGPFMSSNGGNQNFGGPMGAVGFGCKFNTKRRVNFNLNLNAAWRSDRFNNTYTTYDATTGSYYTTTQQGWHSGFFGTACFGIGF